MLNYKYVYLYEFVVGVDSIYENEEYVLKFEPEERAKEYVGYYHFVGVRKVTKKFVERYVNLFKPVIDKIEIKGRVIVVLSDLFPVYGLCEEITKDLYLIFINVDRKDEDVVKTFVHELGHVLQHEGVLPVGRLSDDGYYTWEHEEIVDNFVKEFLKDLR